MRSEDLAEPLNDLRWHWGSAYSISHPEPDVWIAQRLDTREMLRAADPAQLHAVIAANYIARPVPRSLAG